MADVTVVIPFWNLDPKVLQQCVNSVRAQAEPSEILIVDNMSDTPVEPLPGVQMLRLDERVSVGEARNRGLQAVTTPYVMFMDADDVLLPGAIGTLRGLLETTPGASLAAGRIVDWIPETGFRRQKPWPSGLQHKLTRFPKVYRIANLLRNMTPVTGCAVMKTELAKMTAGFPDSTAEDWTFGMHMSFLGRVVMTKKDVKLYRWRVDGLSKQAVWDVKALIEARQVTRRAAIASEFVPQWIKSFSMLVALIHLLELPFHIRRERAFSDMDRIESRPIAVTIDATKVFEERRRNAQTQTVSQGVPALSFTYNAASKLVPATAPAGNSPLK